MRKFHIKVPGSSANLGAGFDALSLGFCIYLNIYVTVEDEELPIKELILSFKGEGSESVSLDESNLICKTMHHVVKKRNAHLPNRKIHIDIENEIPLGRGMGSSGTAVVAGCLLASELCNLKLSTSEILKDALEIENHPDNTSASLLGGFVVSAVDERGTCHFHTNPMPSCIKAVVAIPQFQLLTKVARSVLPSSFSMSQLVYNLQRSSLLVSILREIGYTNKVDERLAKLFRVGILDCVHQPFRSDLIPGLKENLSLNNEDIPGLLGVCLSGAGPTVLAFATHNFEEVGNKMKEKFTEKGVRADILVLDFDNNGSTINEKV
eukprot:TRINITY_DN1872_c0_g1_i2.p1 TRINITY_DN1872_c0_g1~~TRINITY_DN1872_c0_g1_i2.p1  ORF type:complete len:322 (-),score=54.39 TRINITY_DN1872_c0_g1_i2:85-1050(-)